MRHYPRSFYIAILASGLHFFSLLSLSPILPLYTLSIGVDEAGWGMTVTVVATVASTLRLLGGSLTDRVGRKQLMIFGGLALALGSLILLMTGDLTGLLVARALHGVSIGTFMTSYKALTVDLAPRERRGEAVGWGNLTFPIGLIVASPTGEWLQSAYGYSATFLFSVGMALVCVLVVIFMRTGEHVSSQESLIAGARLILPLRTTQVGIWGMLSISAVFTALMTFLPLVTAARGLGGVGLAFSAYSGAQLLSQPFGGKLGDRMGWRPLVIPGTLFGAVGVFLFLIAQTRGVLYIGAFVAGASTGIARVGLDTIVFNGAPDSLRGTVTGLQYASFDLSNGVISWILGIIATRSTYETIYAIMAIIPLLGTVLMWMLIPRPAHHATKHTVLGPEADN